MPQVTLSGIIERDIDFLIMEELVASNDFLTWFVKKARLLGKLRLTSVVQSATSATGETDIELHLDQAGETTFILLENKVDAPLQPRQAERYKDRAARYVKEGACKRCLSGLVAPARYLGDDPSALGFDFTVEYDQILEWYKEAPADRDPRPFKLAVLGKALDRGAMGWTLVPSKRTTEFWRRYWELARALAPELLMLKPTVKPETSGFIHFRPSVFPKGIKLTHKAMYGNVDIQFDGKAGEIEQLTAQYGQLLEPGMTIQRASKSAVIRIEVPIIDLTAPFPESEPAVREGIWAAKLLLLWYKALPKKI